MASRANDAGKDTAIKVKSYGDNPSFQAPTNSNAGRPVASPSNPRRVRDAMAEDAGTLRSMSMRRQPMRYAANSMPLASPTDRPTGIGGAAREKKIMDTVDKMTK
jgi:hypothetical protein